jgi:hypothetical protein
VITCSDSHYLRGQRRFPRVSSILSRARGNALAGVPAYVIDAALARGRAVHAAIEYLNRGELDEAALHPLIVGYVESFRKWRDILRPETLRTEHMWVSEKYQYGGRLDWKCRLKGQFKGAWIIDLKSGAPNPADALQTAAYWNLDIENEPGQTLLRAALYVHRHGATATFQPFTDPTDLAVFLSYRNIYEWEATHHGNGTRDR